MDIRVYFDEKGELQCDDQSAKQGDELRWVPDRGNIILSVLEDIGTLGRLVPLNDGMFSAPLDRPGELGEGEHGWRYTIQAKQWTDGPLKQKAPKIVQVAGAKKKL